MTIRQDPFPPKNFTRSLIDLLLIFMQQHDKKHVFVDDDPAEFPGVYPDTEQVSRAFQVYSKKGGGFY